MLNGWLILTPVTEYFARLAASSRHVAIERPPGFTVTETMAASQPFTTPRPVLMFAVMNAAASLLAGQRGK